jgi:hypothetical protein
MMLCEAPHDIQFDNNGDSPELLPASPQPLLLNTQDCCCCSALLSVLGTARGDGRQAMPPRLKIWCHVQHLMQQQLPRCLDRLMLGPAVLLWQHSMCPGELSCAFRGIAVALPSISKAAGKSMAGPQAANMWP